MTYEEKRYSTKPATHAGYLNGLVCRVQKNPEDKDALAELNYAVSDSTYPVNTREDIVTLIKTAQRLAALPLHNIPQPDEVDESREAAMVREQVRRLAEGEKFEEPAAQESAPVPGATEATAQEPAATEPEPNTKLCCAVDHGTGCASRIYHGTDCPGAESCPVKQYEDKQCEQENAEMEAGLRRNREDATAQGTADPAAMEQEQPAAQEPGPPDYLDTEDTRLWSLSYDNEDYLVDAPCPSASEFVYLDMKGTSRKEWADIQARRKSWFTKRDRRTDCC